MIELFWFCGVCICAAWVAVYKAAARRDFTYLFLNSTNKFSQVIRMFTRSDVVYDGRYWIICTVQVCCGDTQSMFEKPPFLPPTFHGTDNVAVIRKRVSSTVPIPRAGKANAPLNLILPLLLSNQFETLSSVHSSLTKPVSPYSILSPGRTFARPVSSSGHRG
jgi:hypothetical protein